MSAGKIVELKEVIDGIGKKCSFNRERKEQIDREYSLNEQKLIQLTNPSLIAVLEKERDKIDQKNYDVEKEYADLTQKKRELENRISDIEKANKSADIHERIFNISNEELTELYHLYLEKIEYFPITMMKGFYKVQFKSGHSVFIAITKVRCSPQAFLINGNGNGLSSVDLDTGDIHYNYEEPESISTGINDLNFGWKTVSGTVNIRDFFKEDFNKLPFALEIGLDLSYRQRYKEQLDKVTKQKKQPSQT
jgi:hypothetical protein